MTGDHDRDLTARMAELEATVRGLTQELVSAEERIRQLETELDDTATEGEPPAQDANPAASQSDHQETAEAVGTDDDIELEDIIVA
jgi:archaellum component FlaC